MQSWTEIAVVLVVLALLVAPPVLEQARSRSNYQRQIFRIGLVLVELLSPDKGINTARASQRWVPMAFQLLVAATPWPDPERTSTVLRRSILTLSAVFLCATGMAWSRFQTEDL